jgi:hypothetical protein
VTKRIVSLLILPFFLLMVAFVAAQQPLPEQQRQAPVDVTGHWEIEAKNPDGQMGTKSVDLKQNGTVITGHFKGPNQSGGLEGSLNGHHIVFHTKTRTVLTFRGQVEGDTMTGNFGVNGKHGEFHAVRTAAN